MRVVRFLKLAAILCSFGLRNDLKDGRRRQAGRFLPDVAASQWRKGVLYVKDHSCRLYRKA